MAVYGSDGPSGTRRASHAASVRRDLYFLKKEVDALQTHVLSMQKPIWRDLPVLVSVAAFALSLVTAGVSHHQAIRRDISENKIQLRQISQGLAALPRQNAVLSTAIGSALNDMQTQKADQNIAEGGAPKARQSEPQQENIRLLQDAWQSMSAEHSVLVLQAYSIIQQLPADQLAVMELLVIARELNRAGYPELAKELLQKAVDASKSWERVESLREYSYSLAVLREFDEARRIVEETRHELATETGLPVDIRLREEVENEINAAGIELVAGNQAKYIQLLNAAARLAAQIKADRIRADSEKAVADAMQWRWPQ